MWAGIPVLLSWARCGTFRFFIQFFYISIIWKKIQKLDVYFSNVNDVRTSILKRILLFQKFFRGILPNGHVADPHNTPEDNSHRWFYTHFSSFRIKFSTERNKNIINRNKFEKFPVASVLAAYNYY